jgi:hypothetical protein
MSDADIIANEEYFQAHRVVNPSITAVETLNVNYPALQLKDVADTIQVYFHVISKDGTPSGGYVPHVLRSIEIWRIILTSVAGPHRLQTRYKLSTMLITRVKLASNGSLKAPLVPSMPTGSITWAQAALSKLP